MKGLVATGLLLGALPLGAYAGNCTGQGTATQVTTGIDTVLGGHTVCAFAPNGDQWQEYHPSGGGEVVEYAKGSDPTDPTHPVGTWSIASDQVQYNYYDGGGSYAFELWQYTSGTTTYYYCSTSDNTLVATITNRIAGSAAASCGY